MPRSILVFCGLSGALAVILGALGAHALESKLTAESLQGFKTGVSYQFYPTLALLLFAVIREKIHKKTLKYAMYFVIAGIICFSGSIYLLATNSLTGFADFRFLGPVTPVGGVCFIAGWILFAVSFIKS